MNKLKKITATFLCGIALFGPAILPQSAFALFEGAKDQACSGASLGTTTTCDPNQGNKEVSDTLATVINLLSVVVGVIAVIMLIIGGIRFITSQGDGSAVKSARNTIIFAIVGLAVVLMSQLIVQFVLGRITN